VCVRYGQGKTIASLRCFWEFAFVSDSNHLCHNFLSLCFCLSEYSFLGVFDVFLFQEFTHTDSFQFWLLTGNGTFSVQKANGKYRLVQGLQRLNWLQIVTRVHCQ